MAGLVQVTPPTLEPITLAQAKAHLRVDIDDDDDYINALITVARQTAEVYTGRALLTQEWKLFLDKFPPMSGPIYIPWAPLQSVTSITYIDGGANTGTVPGPAGGVGVDANGVYLVNVHREPGIVSPAWSKFWPPVVLQPLDSVIVDYICGYTSPSLIPTPIIQGMYLLIGHWYEYREPVVVNTSVNNIPYGVDMLFSIAKAPPADNFLTDRA